MVTVSNYSKPNLEADKSVSLSCTGATADITSLYVTTGLSAEYSTNNPDSVGAGVYLLIVTNANGCTDTAVIRVMDPSVNPVAASANQKVAERECTDAQGWTHYYNNNGTPTDYSDDIRLLSLRKNGQNIGTIGDGTFNLRFEATPGAGTGRAELVQSPLILSGSFYSMNRYWTVTPTRQPSSPILVRFYYNTQDLRDVDGSVPTDLEHTSLQMYKLKGGNPDPTTDWAGATEVNLYVHGSTPSLTQWTYTSVGSNIHQAEFMVGSFSGGGAGYNASVVLPITLLDFKLQAEKDKVKVLWSTTAEVNSKEFAVERSIDGRTFGPIATIAAAGNSATTKLYYFDDFDGIQHPGTTISYRILLKDRDGRATYTSVKSVRIAHRQSQLSLEYNPVKTQAVLNFQSTIRGKMLIRVMDMRGRVILTRPTVVDLGMNQIKLDVGALAQGIYQVQLANATEQFIVRMMKE